MTQSRFNLERMLIQVLLQNDPTKGHWLIWIGAPDGPGKGDKWRWCASDTSATQFYRGYESFEHYILSPSDGVHEPQLPTRAEIDDWRSQYRALRDLLKERK